MTAAIHKEYNSTYFCEPSHLPTRQHGTAVSAGTCCRAAVQLEQGQDFLCGHRFQDSLGFNGGQQGDNSQTDNYLWVFISLSIYPPYRPPHDFVNAPTLIIFRYFFAIDAMTSRSRRLLSSGMASCLRETLLSCNSFSQFDNPSG